MLVLEKLLDLSPFSLNQTEKSIYMRQGLHELTLHHYMNCPSYQRILNATNVSPFAEMTLETIPMLPVRLFKEFDLLSVDRSEIIKTMTSSGTTGQQVSKVYLDRTTSTNQTKVLAKIMSSFVGNKRSPMLIIDTRSVVKDRNLFSARGAGILGFSMLGYDVNYALDEQMNIDFEVVEAFLEKHKHEKKFLFGFTFMIWEHFHSQLVQSGRSLDINQAIMIHGGGWKKLADRAVDNNTFKRRLKETCGIEQVYNYYGMVEQTGSIYVECEEGYLHASNFSDIVIRDHRNFSVLGTGQQGLIQLVSLLPYSYPGHSILTEDIGELVGIDNCSCGRKGSYFKVHGRIKNAEVRGCSDVYAASR